MKSSGLENDPMLMQFPPEPKQCICCRLSPTKTLSASQVITFPRMISIGVSSGESATEFCALSVSSADLEHKTSCSGWKSKHTEVIIKIDNEEMKEVFLLQTGPYEAYSKHQE